MHGQKKHQNYYTMFIKFYYLGYSATVVARTFLEGRMLVRPRRENTRLYVSPKFDGITEKILRITAV